MSTTEQPPPKAVLPIRAEVSEYRPYLDALRAGILVLPRCSDCQAWLWPPTDACQSCSGAAIWTEVAHPSGTLFSYTVVARTTLAAFRDLTPYVLGIIQLDGIDVRLVGRVLARPEDGLTIDQSLAPYFTTSPDGVPALYWTPA